MSWRSSKPRSPSTTDPQVPLPVLPPRPILGGSSLSSSPTRCLDHQVPPSPIADLLVGLPCVEALSCPPPGRCVGEPCGPSEIRRVCPRMSRLEEMLDRPVLPSTRAWTVRRRGVNRFLPNLCLTIKSQGVQKRQERSFVDHLLASFEWIDGSLRCHTGDGTDESTTDHFGLH